MSYRLMETAGLALRPLGWKIALVGARAVRRYDPLNQIADMFGVALCIVVYGGEPGTR